MSKVKNSVDTFAEPSDSYGYAKVKRNSDGTLCRCFPEDVPCSLRGVVDPDSKLRTTRHLLAVISGREKGEVSRQQGDIDHGIPVTDELRSQLSESLDGLPDRPYRIEPAHVGKYVDALRETAKASVADPSSKDDQSAVSKSDAEPGPKGPDVE